MTLLSATMFFPRYIPSKCSNILFLCYLILYTRIQLSKCGPTLRNISNNTSKDDTIVLPTEAYKAFTIVPRVIQDNQKYSEQQYGSQQGLGGSLIVKSVETNERVSTTREMKVDKLNDLSTSINRTSDSVVITEPLSSRFSKTKNEKSRNPKSSSLDKNLERSLLREYAPDYPEEEISIALKQVPDSLKELFNMQNSPLDSNLNLTERVASYPEQYISGEVREENVCRTVLRSIYPREANKENSLVYIPNNHDFIQVIQSELCVNPDGECSYLQDALPFGMISACQQKYAFKKMLYYNPLEKRMASDMFRYPSCCVCYVKTLPFDLRSSAKSSSTTTTTSTASPDPVFNVRDVTLASVI